MSLVKWTEVSLSPQHDRNKSLSDFMNQNGLTNQYEPMTIDSVEKFSFQELQSNFQVARVSGAFCGYVSGKLDMRPVLQMSLKCVDHLQFIHGKWHGSSLLFDAIRSVLAQDVKKLDLSLAAMIIGTGASARAVAGALANIGFTKISVVARDEKQSQAFVQEVEKAFFKTQFQFIPSKDVTSLPSSFSLLVNCTPNFEKNTLLNELVYFNFLRPGGVIIDLSMENKDPLLLSEAKEIGASQVSGFDVAAVIDSLWIETIFNKKISPKSFVFTTKA